MITVELKNDEISAALNRLAAQCVAIRRVLNERFG